MTFIYTQCPMPTFCPLMDRHFAAIQERLKADPALAQRAAVSVSFDPVTDTPPVLKKHAETLGADPSRWTFLTGDRDEIDQFASRFGVSIARATDRSARHHAQPADGDRRRRRQAGEGLHRQRVDARAGARGPRGSRGPDQVPRGRLERSRRFTPRERRLIARLRTPLAVQRYLNRLPYNTRAAPGAPRCAAFAASSATARAHCLEAALFAAVVLEQHGYPPLVLSFESIDELDHVIFVYRRGGRWGSVARSRDPGPARPAAGLRDAARARAQLRRSVRRFHRTRHRLRASSTSRG